MVLTLFPVIRGRLVAARPAAPLHPSEPEVTRAGRHPCAPGNPHAPDDRPARERAEVASR
jgi:hypothetical protein